ncbi:nucleotide sugar dehydrogenase [Shinella sp. AETb1-6]|uniref:nucleotide sugar dehydrogenase n=1 Tax=Shinella TaxID=323620 RepID=UPI00106EEF8A|nr:MULTISPECIES: nucleotide sugar dehydrogenase [Shinella]MCD1265114.1 nucleotide sugar dehydrogenase [Shinella sumterensis]MXN51221.1 nucleotide sugar dehydrogenase [Shinella sp. AETb1-6]TFE98515.1 UDP-N-acetyl-D-galactosamine dehydrogenase [Shinella sumterensis]
MVARKIAVIGLGYVGLPVAVALAEKFPFVVGFDVKKSRIEALKVGEDVTGEVDGAVLKRSSLQLTYEIADVKDCDFYIVAVPTPIDDNRQPDLAPLIAASKTVASVLKAGDIVVFESTVFPGATEDVCGPILSEISGLRQGVDFNLGYSPERINPGDKKHTFKTITKVVSGDTAESLDEIAAVYEAVVDAGIYKASSIKVAEAAKVIENTQRDLNIALMNELAIIFERMNIRTSEVLAAAGTKWNFLPFTPGLVGGHCIGVDPYYLTAKAESLGYHPQVILSGRRINDGMGAFVAQKMIKMLVAGKRPLNGARIGILGLTFKENVPDLRNSRVPDIIKELRQFGIEPIVHDPLASAEEALEEYDVSLKPLAQFDQLDGLILAVPHESYVRDFNSYIAKVAEGGVIIDIKSVLDKQILDASNRLNWSL